MKAIAIVGLGLTLVSKALLVSATHFATRPANHPDGVEEALFILLSVLFGCLALLVSLGCSLIVATKGKKSIVRLFPLFISVLVVMDWAAVFISGAFGL